MAGTLPPIRVGFILNTASAAWLGGLNYFRSLLSAVAEHRSGEIEPVIFVGHGFPPSALEGFPEVELHRTSGLDRFRPGWLARGASMVTLRHDYVMERTLRAEGIDVLSHSVPPGPRGSVPTLAWIPDFQHVHLPQFFSARELRFRNRHFRALADHSSLLMLSSRAAARDLASFRPAAAAKARVLPFVVEPPADRPAESDLRARFGLEQPFVLIANQFWAHKNHLVAVDALAALRDRGVEVSVAATGDSTDYRAAGVYERVMARAAELHVEDRFHALGRVDYRDVAGLMETSVAVLNPSLFEGWNTAVEEAKSLGVRVVASDIAVHREQDPPRALFFDPHDPVALADAIQEVADGAGAPAGLGLATDLPARRAEFASRYVDTLRETLVAG